MTPSATTRKPVEQLTAVDLETYPIWEFVSDDGGQDEEDGDEDETWVKPVLADSIPPKSYTLCMAAAARLASGAIYPAVLFGDTVEGFSIDGLALLTTEGRVLFHGSDSASEKRLALKRLGLGQRDVFPIEFATRAPLAATGAHVFGRWE
ncbi:hypothetical protein ACQ86G_19255 [Roseateles chitinivorans]|uniref:hypothetical protein n=1 Tax=Roseateles chitinivorans TaxID=2917965 RepID=UPI003D672D62